MTLLKQLNYFPGPTVPSYGVVPSTQTRHRLSSPVSVSVSSYPLATTRVEEESIEIGEKSDMIHQVTTAPGQTEQISCSHKHQRQSGTDPYYHAALVVTSSGRYEILKVPTQSTLGDFDVMISTRAVGLNPIDWKSVDFGMCLPEFPWIIGREMTGVVERVGAGVRDLSPGDHVWTSTYYKKREAGCFQHRVIAPAHTVLHIPPNLDFESAACLGVPGITAAMTLWHWLRGPMPSQQEQQTLLLQQHLHKNRWMLIWGGSTITGQFLIQLASLSGFCIITVTSSKTATLVQELGATYVVTRDGKPDETIADEVRQIVQANREHGELTLAVDIVGPSTAVHAVSALSRSEPAMIAPISFLPKGYEVPSNVTVADIQMKQFILDERSRVYALELNRLIAEGKLRVPQFECLEGGLAAIPAGLEASKRGDRMGKKLVVAM